MTNIQTSSATRSDTPALLAPSDAPVLEHLGMLCRVVLSGEQTAGAFALVEERSALGGMTPRHLHLREAETFIVLEGALEGWCEGETALVEAGSMIHLPPRREHAFRVASASAHFYTLISPAGFEKFFPATGSELARRFEGDLPVPGPVPAGGVALLQQVLDPLGVTITGPPPFAVPGGP